MMDKSPKGWVDIFFIDLISSTIHSMKRGPFGSAIKKSFFVSKGFKVYEQQNAIKNDASLGRYYIDEKKYKELENFKISSGDYIISCSGTIGKITKLPNNCEAGIINQALLKITLDHRLIDSDYFLYLFRSYSFQEIILKDTRGSGMKNLASVKDIKNLRLMLPPTNEQKRIVAKIEVLFSELDKGVESLKFAQEQLKTYRQSILKHAFEGIEKKETLENISEAVGGFAFKSTSLKEGSGKYQVIRIGNVRPGLIRESKSPVFIDEVEDKIIHRYLLQTGDVLISLTGTRNKRDYGYSAIVNKNNLLINQRVAYLRFGSSYLPKFFLYFSWTEYFKKQFFGSETGNTGQGNVSIKSIKSTTVPSCSIDKQQQIVSKIEEKFSVIDQLEKDITDNLKRSETLRQAILKKAFSGKLVPQDPNDEPASVLLERIKAEKVKNRPKNRRN